MKTRTEITSEAVAALPQGGRLYDPTLRGFGVRRNKGGVSYFFRWRAAGKHREVGLGIVGEVTITAARRKAAEFRGQLAVRIDPLDKLRQDAAAKREAEAAAKAASAARMPLSRFAQIYAESVPKKPSSKRSDESLLRLHILPRLGDVDVADLNRLHAQKLHDALSATPTRANRAFALLSHMLTVAAAKGYREAPLPRKSIKKNPEPPRDRYLTPAEHANLWRTLCEMDATPHRDAAQALRLLIVTGCRKNEVVRLRWDEVDEDCLRLADSKTGRRTVPLAGEAIAILKARRSGSRSAFVFPSESSTEANDGPRADVETAWRIARHTAKLPGVRIHDLRHSFAAAAVHAGLTLTEIGKLLGHKAPATTARYAHVSDAVARAAADKVGDRFRSIVEASGGLRAAK